MSKRVEQINELIRQELGGIFSRELEFPIGSIATITKVRTQPDGRTTDILLVVQPTNKTGEVLRLIRKKAGHLQRVLNRTLAMQHVPRLAFAIDPNPDERDEIDDIFQELDKERGAGG